jgi:hypothetical protein
VAVRDSRGTSITLSHFCPTAAASLFREDVPVTIVESPSGFPPAAYEGLVVTGDDLPPLLSPRMLMDPQAYAAWERHMVAVCADDRRTPESVVATLYDHAARVSAWTPNGASPLAEVIASLPPGSADAPVPDTVASSLILHRQAIAAVPDDLKPARDEAGLGDAYRVHVLPAWGGFRAPLNRYLAAKAFASWTAYQGRGIRTIVRGLDAALAVVRVEAARQCRDAGDRTGAPLDRAMMLEAFRAADFLLNHLAVGEDLARVWGAIER